MDRAAGGRGETERAKNAGPRSPRIDRPGRLRARAPARVRGVPIGASVAPGRFSSTLRLGSLAAGPRPLRRIDEEELRPRHERPPPRPARDLPVRGQQRHHPDLRHRGGRPVQARGLRARPQRAHDRAAPRRAPRARAARSRKGVPLDVGRHAARRRARASAPSCRARIDQARDGPGHPPDRVRRARAATAAGPRSSSRWTRTCASAPTRSAWSPRPTRTSASRSSSSTPASIELEVDRRRDRRVLPATGASPRRALGERSHAERAACCCATRRTRRTPRSAATTRPSSEIVALRDAARRRDGRAPAQQGAELRASISCSTRRSAWSRWSARPARARRSSRSPRASSARSRTAPTRACSCRARSCRSGATSASCPGDVDEKLNPWMQPIFDNLEFLFSTRHAQGPARLRRAARERADPGRAAHVHPRALACRSST